MANKPTKKKAKKNTKKKTIKAKKAVKKVKKATKKDVKKKVVKKSVKKIKKRKRKVYQTVMEMDDLYGLMHKAQTTKDSVEFCVADPNLYPVVDTVLQDAMIDIHMIARARDRIYNISFTPEEIEHDIELEVPIDEMLEEGHLF